MFNSDGRNLGANISTLGHIVLVRAGRAALFRLDTIHVPSAVRDDHKS